MYSMFPIIKGIVATDLNGFICDQESNLITSYSDELTRKLDHRVLTGFIESEVKLNSLFVVGENTWKAMGGKLRGTIGASGVVVSSQDGAQHLSERIKYSDNVSTKVQLMNYVYEVAMRRKMNIVVLGGKSVYEAFAGQYAQLVHCEVKTDEVMQGKKIQIKAKDLTNRDGNEFFFTPHVSWHSPINNETYNVKVYGDYYE